MSTQYQLGTVSPTRLWISLLTMGKKKRLLRFPYGPTYIVTSFAKMHLFPTNLL